MLITKAFWSVSNLAKIKYNNKKTGLKLKIRTSLKEELNIVFKNYYSNFFLLGFFWDLIISAKNNSYREKLKKNSLGLTSKFPRSRTLLLWDNTRGPNLTLRLVHLSDRTWPGDRGLWLYSRHSTNCSWLIVPTETWGGTCGKPRLVWRPLRLTTRNSSTASHSRGYGTSGNQAYAGYAVLDSTRF